MLRRHPDAELSRLSGGRGINSWSAIGAGVVGGCLLLLALFLWMASGGLILSILAIGAAGLLTVLVTLGLERTATVVLTTAMFFAPLNSVRPTQSASFVTVADLLFVIGLGLLFPIVAFRKCQPPAFFVIGSVILMSAGVLTSLGSSDPGLSLNHMIRLIVSAFILPIAFMFWRPSQRTVLWLASAYVLGQLVSVAFCYVNGPDPISGRYDGLTTHFNFFGLSALLAASLTPYIAASVTGSLRWAAWGAGLICAYGIWISGSRAALLVLILVALLYPLLGRSLAAAGFLYAGGTVVIVLSSRLIDKTGNNALSRLMGGGEADYADVERKAAFKAGVVQFHDHPLLGSGFANALAAHNIYLELAVAVGVLGTVGYIFLLWATIRPLFSLPKPFSLLGYPGLAYATEGLITNALWDRFIWSVLTLGLIAHLLVEDDTNDEPVPAQELQQSVEDR